MGLKQAPANVGKPYLYKQNENKGDEGEAEVGYAC
jgi:hypothetical protein